MEEQDKTLEDYLAILRRRKWQLIVPTVALSLLALVFTMRIPATYRSTATILIEQQEIPTDLVRTTVTSFADQRIQVISQRVMTTKNLSGLIERYNLYPGIRSKGSMNSAVELMRQSIKLDTISADVLDPNSGRSQGATIAFSLSFESSSPTLAQQVTSDLVSLYLDENLEQRAAAANEATTFLDTEANRLADEIGALEGRMASFKKAHADNLPELATLNREQMTRTEDRLRENTQAEQTLRQQERYLAAELSQLSPSTGGQTSNLKSRLNELEAQYVRIKERYSPEHPDRLQLERELPAMQKLAGESGTGVLRDRLADLRSELAQLRQRYSDDHPDVASLKRSIAATERELADAARRGDTGGGDVTNPAYVQIKTQLESVRLEIASLKRKRQELEQDIASFEARAKEAPRIEQDYLAITRDYDNAKNKYREVRDKALQAQLAQSLERNRKGERFSLLEPPLVPERPFKPNRMVILMLGLMVSVAGGVGNLALQEGLDKGLHGARAVQAVTRIPLLASIPFIETRQDRLERQRRRSILLGAGLGALLLGALAIHLLVMPLDVLWFSLLRRFGGAPTM